MFDDKIKEILSNYSKDDAKLVKDTVDMLCSKGIANGCYQDMTVLMDILTVLSLFESAVEHMEN